MFFNFLLNINSKLKVLKKVFILLAWPWPAGRAAVQSGLSFRGKSQMKIPLFRTSQQEKECDFIQNICIFFIVGKFSVNSAR